MYSDMTLFSFTFCEAQSRQAAACLRLSGFSRLKDPEWLGLASAATTTSYRIVAQTVHLWISCSRTLKRLEVDAWKPSSFLVCAVDAC